MWVNHPQIRRIRRWLKVEINPNEPIYNYIARFETAMDDAKTTSLTWENFNLLFIILGTRHDKFIEDVLKEAKQDPKRLSKELIRETWEALSLMKNEGLDTKGNHNKPKKEITGMKKDRKQEQKKPTTTTPA